MAKFQPSADKLNMVMDQLEEVDALLLQLTAEWKDKKDKGIDTLNKTHKKVTASAKNYVNLSQVRLKKSKDMEQWMSLRQ